MIRKRIVTTPAKCGGSCLNPPEESTNSCAEICYGGGTFVNGKCDCPDKKTNACCLKGQY